MRSATTALVLLVSSLISARPIREGKHSSEIIESVDGAAELSVGPVKGPIEKCLDNHPALCARADHVAARDGIADSASWIVDSGADGHTCNDVSLMTDIRHVEGEIGGFAGGKTFVSKAGTVYLTLAPVNGYQHTLELRDVLLVPGDVNLISAERLAQSGIFYRNDREQLFATKPYEVIGQIDRYGHSPILRLAGDHERLRERGRISDEDHQQAHETTTTAVITSEKIEAPAKSGNDTRHSYIFHLPAWCMYIDPSIRYYPRPECMPKITKRALALEAGAAISPKPYQSWARHQYCKEYAEDAICVDQPQYQFHIRDEPELKFLAEKAAIQIQPAGGHDRVLKAPAHLAVAPKSGGSGVKRAVHAAQQDPDRLEQMAMGVYKACIEDKIQWATGEVEGDELRDITKKCKDETDFIIYDGRSVQRRQSTKHSDPTPTGAEASEESAAPPRPLATLTANETDCMLAMVMDCAKNNPHDECLHNPWDCIDRTLIYKDQQDQRPPHGYNSNDGDWRSWVPRPKHRDGWIPGHPGYVAGWTDDPDTVADRKKKKIQKEWEKKENNIDHDKQKREVAGDDHIYHNDHYVIPYRCRDGSCNVNITKELPEGGIEAEKSGNAPTIPNSEAETGNESTITPRSNQFGVSPDSCESALLANCPGQDLGDCVDLAESVCDSMDRRVLWEQVQISNGTEDDADPSTYLYWSTFWKQAFCTGEECDKESPAKTIVHAIVKAAKDEALQSNATPNDDHTDSILPRGEGVTSETDFSACPIIDPLCNKKKRDIESVRENADPNPRAGDINPRAEHATTSSEFAACPIIDPLCNKKKRDIESVRADVDLNPRAEETTANSEFTACPVWDILCNKKRDTELAKREADLRTRGEEVTADSDFTACPIIDPLCNKKRGMVSAPESEHPESDIKHPGLISIYYGSPSEPRAILRPTPKSGSNIEVDYAEYVDTTIAERSEDIEEEAECDECAPCPMIDIFCNKKKRAAQTEIPPIDQVDNDATNSTDADVAYPAFESEFDDIVCPGHPRCHGPITYGPIKATRDAGDNSSEPHSLESPSSDWRDAGVGSVLTPRDSEESLIDPAPTRTLEEELESTLRLIARDNAIGPPKDCEHESCFSLWPQCLATGMCQRHPPETWDPAVINAHYSDVPEPSKFPVPMPPAPYYSDPVYHKKPWVEGDPPYPEVEPRPSSDISRRDAFNIPPHYGEDTPVPQPTYTDVNKNDAPRPLPPIRGFGLEPTICDCHSSPIEPACMLKCAHPVRSIQDDPNGSPSSRGYGFDTIGSFDRKGHGSMPSTPEDESDRSNPTCNGMDCLVPRSTPENNGESQAPDNGNLESDNDDYSDILYLPADFDIRDCDCNAEIVGACAAVCQFRGMPPFEDEYFDDMRQTDSEGAEVASAVEPQSTDCCAPGYVGPLCLRMCSTYYLPDTPENATESQPESNDAAETKSDSDPDDVPWRYVPPDCGGFVGCGMGHYEPVSTPTLSPPGSAPDDASDDASEDTSKSDDTSDLPYGPGSLDCIIHLTPHLVDENPVSPNSAPASESSKEDIKDHLIHYTSAQRRSNDHAEPRTDSQTEPPPDPQVLACLLNPESCEFTNHVATGISKALPVSEKKGHNDVEPRADNDTTPAPDPYVLACLVDPEDCDSDALRTKISNALPASKQTSVDDIVDYIIHRTITPTSPPDTEDLFCALDPAACSDVEGNSSPASKNGSREDILRDTIHLTVYPPNLRDPEGLACTMGPAVCKAIEARSSSSSKIIPDLQELLCRLDPSTCDPKADDGRESPEFYHTEELPDKCSEDFTHWGCKETKTGLNCRCWPNQRIEDEMQEELWIG